jgi:hypothetical protein
MKSLYFRISASERRILPHIDYCHRKANLILRWGSIKALAPRVVAIKPNLREFSTSRAVAASREVCSTLQKKAFLFAAISLIVLISLSSSFNPIRLLEKFVI